MKNLIILFSVIVFATSCEKEPLPSPPRHYASDELNWNLYFKVTYKEHTYILEGIKPYKITELVNCEPPYYQQETIGNSVCFKNADSTLNLNFHYYLVGGVKRVSGVIEGHTFISTFDINDSTATINICNSTQGLPIQYNLFHKTNSNS